jgi:hypothetical protein
MPSLGMGNVNVLYRKEERIPRGLSLSQTAIVILESFGRSTNLIYLIHINK